MVVSFIGHRKINNADLLKNQLTEIVENMIINDDADFFLFGSASEFNDLCYSVVTELKGKYSHIKRVYVRAEYEYINPEYVDYILNDYEDTFFPVEVHGAGVRSYIKRNQVMIDSCDCLIAYCDENYVPTKQTRSGTHIAVAYAYKNNKKVINMFKN